MGVNCVSLSMHLSLELGKQCHDLNYYIDID